MPWSPLWGSGVTLRCHCPLWWPWGTLWVTLEDLGVSYGVGGPSWCHRGLGTPQIPLWGFMCHPEVSLPPLGPICWPWGMCGSHWRTWGRPMGLEDLHGVTVGWGHPKSLCGVLGVTLRCHCPLWVSFGSHLVALGDSVGHAGGPGGVLWGWRTNVMSLWVGDTSDPIVTSVGLQV